MPTYQDAGGTKPGIPAGSSISIKEKTAPAGYQLDSATYKIAFKDAGEGKIQRVNLVTGTTIDTVNVSNAPDLAVASEETPGTVSINVTKKANGTMPTGATLDGVKFALVSRNGSKPVVVGNKTYTGNNTILEILTVSGSNGAATATVTSKNKYPAGNYRVYELRSDATYQAGDTWDGNSAKHGSSNTANAHFGFATNQLDVTISGVQATAGTTISAGTATNTPSPKYFDATVKKVDAAGRAVAGAKFNLRYNNTDHVGTTGADGSYTWKNIPWTAAGISATLTETSAPAGYQIDPAYAAPGKSITLKADPGATYNLGTITNAQLVKIKINKQANGTMPPGATLDGIKFAIVSRNGSKQIQVGGKTYSGNDTILEILTISGSNGADTASVTSANSFPVGNYRVYELRSDNTYAVGDTWDGNSAKHGSSTSANAHFRFATNQLNVTVDGAQVAAGATVNAGTATNTPSPKYFDATVKKVDNAGKAVAGATFNLRYDGKDHVGTTGADGSYTWKHIPWTAAGTAATLIETKAPAGYQIDPAYAAPGKSITLKANPGATFNLGTVTNAALVSATLKKVDDAGKPIAGVVFNLKYDNTDYKKTTGADGTATWTGIISGTKATLIEESVPAGYDMDPAYVAPGKAVTITANAGETYNLGSITNTPQLGKVRVEKKAAKVQYADETKVDLSGLTFRLTGTSLLGNAVNMTAITNADGIALFEDVPFGNNYTVKEELTTAQKAMWKPAEAMPVTVSASAMGTAGYVPVNATNTPLPGSLTIVKVVPEGEKTGGAGFNFLISGTSDAGYTYSQTVTTNATGKVTVNGIPYGTYSVEEKLTAEQQKVWETKSANSVTINAEKKEVTFTFTQTEKTTQVTLKKVSEDGKVQGFKFTITGTRSIGGSFTKSGTTDAKGEIDFGKVPYGNYTVEENLTAAQKLIYGEPTINPKSFTLSDENQALGIVATAKNELIRGQIKVVKTDKETGDGSVQGNATLEGIQFAIVNRTGETAFLPNGSEIADGAIAAILTTDKKGEAATPAEYLQMGKYDVVELRKDSVFNIGDAYDAKAESAGESILANDSYLYAEQKQPATLAYKGNPNPTVDMAYSDTVVKGGVSIVKKDAELADGAQGNGSLAGILFAVINTSQEKVLVGGVVIEPNEIAAIITTNAEGKAECTANLPYGTYKLVELWVNSGAAKGEALPALPTGDGILANDSYLWDKNEQTITLTENGVVKAAEKDATNRVVEGHIKVVKVDEETEETQGDTSLADIYFAIVNDSANAVMIGSARVEKGAVAAVVKTNEKGECETGELPYGSYTVYEMRMDAEKQGIIGKAWADVEKGTSVYANASYLWAENKQPMSVTKHNEIKVTPKEPNKPVPGSLEIIKEDAEMTAAQGDAVLTGIRYAIINMSAKAVKVNGTLYPVGQIVEIVTLNAEGKAYSSSLPYGTYRVVELRKDAAIDLGDKYKESDKLGVSTYANDSYQWSEQSKTQTVRENGKQYSLNYTNPVVRGGVSITKRDFYTDDIPQGDAGFIGVRYAVINRSAEEVLLPDGTVIPKDAVTLVLTADKDGKAQSSAKALAYGTYDVIELRIDSVAEIGKEVVMGSHEMANYSYLWKNLVHRIEVREEGKIYEATKDGKVFENEPEEPKNPELFKYDLDLGTNKTQGGASFEGIRFALINRSANPVFVEHFEKLFVPGQVIDVIQSTAEGIIELPYTMSYGTYGLMELSTLSTVKQGDMFDEISDIVKYGVSKDRLGQLYANASYMYTDREEKTFKAITRADGHVEYDTSLLHFDNKVVRAGIYFEKKIESTQEHLPYVVFKVTLKETGETHYIMTNHNAYYGTDQLYNLHSNNTNGIDAIVKPYAEEGFIPQAIIDELIAKEAWNWGTWFGTAPVNDKEYALPFGSYDMEEIKSPANEKYFMYRNDDFKIWYNYQYHSFGTIFNREMGILTSAVDAGTNTREGFATKNAKILDTVTYNGLVPGASYELVATLMAKNAEGKWEQIKGIEVHKTFIPKVENHYEVMEIVFDATPYEDKDVVVFEELRDANGTVIAEHKSLTDAKQTVSYKPVPKSGMAIEKKEISTPKHEKGYWAGEVVKYKITVTNTGEVALEDITVTDAKLGFEDVISRLMPGKSKSFTVEYVVTPAEAKAGKVHNVATAEVEDPYGPTGSSTITVEDDEDVKTFEPVVGLSIAKVAVSEPKNGIAYLKGETVKYQITVTNPGEVDLRDVEVEDAALEFEAYIGLLRSGKSRTFTVTYKITEEDTLAGKFVNIATATCEDPTSSTENPKPDLTEKDEEEVPAMEFKPGYEQNKEVVSIPKNGIAYVEGEVITFKLSLNNTGNQPLTITVKDELVAFEKEVKLAPGESWAEEVYYTVTKEDAEAGHVLNVMTSKGIPPYCPPEEPPVEITPPPVEQDPPTMVENPAYEQEKTVISKPKNGIAYVEGETIIFKLSLKNTGNLPLIVKVSDKLLGFEEEVKLAVDGAWEVELPYEVTKEDAEAGHVLNVLTSKGTPERPPQYPDPENDPPIVPEDKEQDPPTMIENPAYEQEKTVVSAPKNGIAYVEGETIIFKLSLKNTGNLPLVIEVKDELVDFSGTIMLPVGGEWEKEVTYEVTKEDAEAGHVLNVLTSTGKPDRPEEYPDPENDPPITPEDETVDPPTMVEEPAYEQEKELTNAPKNGVAYVEGEEVTYKITLKNTGNLPLIIEVKDELVGYAETIKLAIGETFTKDFAYTVTAEDVEAGKVLNVLTSSCKPERPEDYPDPEGDEPIVPEDKEVEVPTIDPKPHITIIKETVNKPANGVGFVEGEEVIFRITVINDGNMDFERATVKDEMLDFEAVITSFMAGDKKSFDLKHTTTREEAEAGRIYNVATVTAPNPNEPNDPENPTITEKDDEENPATLTGTVTVIYVDKKGKVLIEKTVVLDEVPVGTEYKTIQEEIEHYRFVEMDEKSAPAAGKVVEGTQDVIYVYEKISQPKPTEPMKEPETDPEAKPETEPWYEEESKGNTPPAPIPFQNTPPETGDRNILPFYILLFIGTLGTMLLLIRGKDWEG